MSAGVVKRHMRRSRSLTPAIPPGTSALLYSPLPPEGLIISHQQSRDVISELQRVSYLFQGASFISEAEFVTNCKSVMNIMRYSHSEDTSPRQQELLVEVIENAVITFIIRLLPLVFHELIAPTSLLHPISPSMVVSLLEVADTHVDVYGDFTLQLRVAAIHQLLRDNEDVALVFSMCQSLPRIQPNPTWQPVIHPVKAHPISNVQGSISLPEIHPPLFSVSPSLTSSSMLGSPVPSLSSLLNCTPSSSESVLFHACTISESVSHPTVSLVDTNPVTLTISSSMPNVRCASAPINTSTSVAPPVIAFEDHSFRLDISLGNPLFSPPFLSPSHEDIGSSLIPIAGCSAAQTDMAMPNIRVQLPRVEDDAASPRPHDTTFYPSIISIVSQDDLSKLISCPDVGEEPPPPSLFSPPPEHHPVSLDTEFSISISAPDSQGDDPTTQESSKTDSVPLSPLPNHVSSPLSSPPEIIVQDDGDNFRNTFKLDVQKRPPSPYNKRLRSASNNLLPGMKRVVPSPRTASVSTRRRLPLDLDLAALTLPSPPRRKTFSMQEADKVVAVVGKKKTLKRAKPMPAPVESMVVIQDGDDSSVPRHRWGRVASGSLSLKSMEKENP